MTYNQIVSRKAQCLFPSWETCGRIYYWWPPGHFVGYIGRAMWSFERGLRPNFYLKYHLLPKYCVFPVPPTALSHKDGED